MDKFKCGDDIRFLNKNTGYVLQGIVKRALKDRICVCLVGDSEEKFLDDMLMVCFQDNHNKVNVS